MWSLIGRVFGSDKAASSLIDNVSKGLDKLVYTGEEKAEADARAVTEARSMVIDWLRTTSGQNLARRILAFMVASVWLGFYVATAAVAIAGIWVSDPDVAEKLIESGDVLSERATQMNGAMMLILGFYFAAPHLGKVVDKALTRFSKRESG